jgi:hypothetical protein
MKKFSKWFAVLALALGIGMVGCTSLPSSDTMYSTTCAIGVATGMVANGTDIDDASRNAICDIMNEVSQCIPETNQTFSAAWTPIAKAHADSLVADGKITAEQGVLVMKAFDIVVSGIDYVFEVRYPKAKQYKELVSAAVDGFTDGFLSVFKQVDGALSSGRSVTFDIDAYEWLKKNAVK